MIYLQTRQGLGDNFGPTLEQTGVAPLLEQRGIAPLTETPVIPWAKVAVVGVLAVAVLKLVRR